MGPILFNIFINDLILFIKQANLHNYADNNTITYFSKSLSCLKTLLENESAEGINWLKQNNMLVNPKKIQVLFLSRKKELIRSDMSLNINSNSMICSNWVNLLGIKIDNSLNFEPPVSDLCKSAARPFNALLTLKHYLTFEARKIMIKSFVCSNFNYCPLVWNFTIAKAINKIESVQKRELRFLFENYESSYDTILMKAQKPTMTVQRLRYLCTEIYKTVNDLNPSYMKNVFKKSDTIRSKQTQHQNNLIVLRPNYYEFGTKCLISLGPKIWDSLPVNITSAEMSEVFKKLIKIWNREMCKCRMCTYKNH